MSRRLRELNPGFDGKVARRLDGNGVVINVALSADNVTNLTPLRALPKLKEVICNGSGPGKGKLTDLSPLRGLALERFECGWTEVSDLAPLAGMPLRHQLRRHEGHQLGPVGTSMFRRTHFLR